ncbi:MAG TPA: NotI family restriction endonuclease [Nitrospiraceae bacterium]|nr:NotI family restriction endonuclease [Nitrospiraceae bacterium]
MTKPQGSPAAATQIAELYGLPTHQPADWKSLAKSQPCPFLARKCLKNRKSSPNQTIGTCTMIHGKDRLPILICPFRLLERSQVFTDCTHLLQLHEPGNELRIVAELGVPGGSVDYCLVSVRDGKPRDFVGIELQTMDTTGTAWPKRQRFLRSHGVSVNLKDVAEKPFGMNWKMTAKTILVQLNHKIKTFEHLGKHLVLVLQDHLLHYMQRAFAFDHIRGVRDGDPMHFYAYELRKEAATYELRLKDRLSTDSAGVAACLGIQVEAKVELTSILNQIQEKLPRSTLLTIGEGVKIPIPESTDRAADDDS